MGLDYSLAVISVAEISVTKLNQFQEEIHETLRDKYPLKMEEVAKNVSVNIDEDNNAKTVTKTSPILAFVSADRNDAVIITCERISFHTKRNPNTEYIINELLEAFNKVFHILDIKHIGNVAIRYIYNFSLSDNGNTFDGFLATNLLAPTINCMKSKGPSMFESTYVDDKNIVIMKASVQMNTPILAQELMDSAVRQLKISEDRVNVLARIDLDSIYNCDGTFRLLNIEEITNNLSAIGRQADSFYAELQQGV